MRFRTLVALAAGLAMAGIMVMRDRAKENQLARSWTPAWVMLASTPQASWYLDTVRIEPLGRMRQVWLRYDYPAPRRMAWPRPLPYSRVELQERVDCASGSISDERLRLLDARGGVVAEPAPSSPPDHPLRDAVPALCLALEARRQGDLARMVGYLRRSRVTVPVPGRIGGAGVETATVEKR